MKSIADLLQGALSLCRSYEDEDIDRSDNLIREVLKRTDSIEEAILALNYSHECGDAGVKAFNRCVELAQTPIQQEVFAKYIRTHYTGDLLVDVDSDFWFEYQAKAAKDPSIMTDALVVIDVLKCEFINNEFADGDSVTTTEENIKKLFALANELVRSPIPGPFSDFAHLRAKLAESEFWSEKLGLIATTTTVPETILVSGVAEKVG